MGESAAAASAVVDGLKQRRGAEGRCSAMSEALEAEVETVALAIGEKRWGCAGRRGEEWLAEDGHRWRRGTAGSRQAAGATRGAGLGIGPGGVRHPLPRRSPLPRYSCSSVDHPFYGVIPSRPGHHPLIDCGGAPAATPPLVVSSPPSSYL
jgi:hypothetical protein